MKTTYKLTQDYCKEDVQYVSISMNPKEFDLLLAYIQFNFEDITENYPLIAYDMAEKILPLYGGSKESATEVDDEFKFDLYFNREYHCPNAFEIQAMDKFFHPELKQTLTKIFDEIIFQNS